MRQGRQGAPLRGALLLLLFLWARSCIPLYAQESYGQGDRKFGDKCSQTTECGFEGSICDDISGKCLCKHELPVTNHLDKCGVAVRVNESCFFNEQCEAVNYQTECNRDGVCACRFEKLAVIRSDGQVECIGRGDRKFGDKCSQTTECGFEGSICDDISGKCLCKHELPVTNHLDKCGVAVRVNESCFFNEQCEAVNYQTECNREGVCACRFEKLAVIRSDGQVECIVVQMKYTPEKYIDPAMIGILVAMFLMFITICVVLRLFSKARWRENRTIFNTPNPRLMNVSLLKDNKQLHDRRGSRTSRGPSRQPSMASLRAHSPNSQGSRRGSRGSSNISAASTRSNKSPPQAPNLNSATTPMLESVTIEIQVPKA